MGVDAHVRYHGRINLSREETSLMLKKVVKGALVVAAVGVVACAIVHRNVIIAAVKGAPMPEPPEWHKQCGIH